MLSTIPNYVFITAIAILTGYLTFLTTKGGLTDNRYSNVLERLTKRGKIVICLLLLIASTLLIQEFSAQKKNERNNKLLKQIADNRDSLIRQGIDSFSNKLYDDISLAFKKQALILDTVNKEVIRMRDSSKIVVNNYPQEDPIIMIDSDGLKTSLLENGSLNCMVSILSKNAGSTDYQINTHVVVGLADNSFLFIRDYKMLSNSLKIPKDLTFDVEFQIANGKNIETIFLYFLGTYSTIDKKKDYEINEVFGVDTRTNITRVILNELRDKVLHEVRTHRYR